jgi:lipopolysaccharide/colanic/teichoic acid biosynthesis glycosyltransferase
MQRTLDLLLSSIALILLLPLLLPIALILRFSGEGEVFFRQERIGKQGKPFKLLKFATMLKDSPSIGTGTVTTRNDPRVLPVGRILRKTKINELPQLVNILLGDMSVVGPRPQAGRCFLAFPIEFRAKIVAVKPGLSGVGSIVFRREEDLLADAEDSIDFYDSVIAPYKAQLETWYVDHRSIVTYCLVIFATAWVVFIPTSGAVWRIFPGLPAPPDELKRALNYPTTSV